MLVVYDVLLTCAFWLVSNSSSSLQPIFSSFRNLRTGFFQYVWQASILCGSVLFISSICNSTLQGNHSALLNQISRSNTDVFSAVFMLPVQASTLLRYSFMSYCFCISDFLPWAESISACHLPKNIRTEEKKVEKVLVINRILIALRIRQVYI